MPPDTQRGSSLAMMLRMAAGSDSSLLGELAGGSTSGDLLIEILRSRTLAEHIISRFNLQKVYRASLLEDARNTLANHTVISEDRKSGTINITVTDHDPRRAQEIAGAYVEELNRLVVASNTSAAHRERVFLEERLDLVKQDLEVTEKEFGEFASKNAAIDVPQQGKAMVDAAATLQGQIIAAQSELSGLEQIYTANNVRVRSLQARIAELQRQLNKVGGLNDDHDTADDGSLYPSIRKLPLLGIRYADLYRQMKIQETVLEVLTRQYELAKVEEAKELPSIRVLDAPELPERKSWPPRLSLGLLGAFFCLLATMAWVIGASKWQELDPEDWRRVLARQGYVRWSIIRDRGLQRAAARAPWLLRRFRNEHQPGDPSS